MGIFGIAKKGFGMLGKKSGTIKSVSPHVGSLKKTRAVQDDMIKSIDKGKKLKGKEEVHKILTSQKNKKLHDLVKRTGDLHYSIHKRNVGSKKMFRQASGKK
jgi:5-methylcytosine-specific restriction endonuclease McrA